MQADHGRRPHAYNRDDAARVVELAQKINEHATNKADLDKVELLHTVMTFCLFYYTT